MSTRFALLLIGVLVAPACTEGRSATDGGVRLGVANSEDIGRYVTDERGRAVYTLVSGGKDVNACDGACAETWAPLPGADRPAESTEAAIQHALVGATLRRDGRLQLTYSGYPLHYGRATAAPQPTVADQWGRWSLLFPHGEPMTPP